MMDTRKRWITSGRQCGKTLQAEQMERDFIIDHPDAVIIRHGKDGTIVEKPISAKVEDVPAIEDQRATNKEIRP